MEKIHSITTYKGGAVAINDKGQTVNLHKGSTYKILGNDNNYHKATYLGGKDYVEKKTLGNILKNFIGFIITLVK